jgi:hypothetical protein
MVWMYTFVRTRRRCPSAGLTDHSDCSTFVVPPSGGTRPGTLPKSGTPNDPAAARPPTQLDLRLAQIAKATPATCRPDMPPVEQSAQHLGPQWLRSCGQRQHLSATSQACCRCPTGQSGFTCDSAGKRGAGKGRTMSRRCSLVCSRTIALPVIACGAGGRGTNPHVQVQPAATDGQIIDDSPLPRRPGGSLVKPFVRV